MKRRHLNAVTIAIAMVMSMAAQPKEAKAEMVFGEVTQEFNLGDNGYDTAGGNDPDENYFHTFSGIEKRKSDSTLDTTIPNPGGEDIYGIASDGSKVFAANGGSKIFGYDGNIWDGGLFINETGARGLAVSDDYFFLVVDSGANIARIDRSTGTTLNDMDISGILSEGWGLGYMKPTNELVLTDGTDELYRLQLTPDFSGIDSYTSAITTGLGSDQLLGAGYNESTHKLMLNNHEDTGQYANGVIPEPSTFVLLAGLFGAGALYATGRPFSRHIVAGSISRPPSSARGRPNVEASRLRTT